MTEPITIIIDTREQCPWCFSRGVESVRGTLGTGDYSVLGFEGEIAIERKSGLDLLGSLTWGRERFDRELARMRAIRWRAVVVEATLGEVLAGCGRSRATPSSILGSVCAIVADGTPVLFTAGPVEASALAERLLVKMHKRALAARSEAA